MFDLIVVVVLFDVVGLSSWAPTTGVDDVPTRTPAAIATHADTAMPSRRRGPRARRDEEVELMESIRFRASGRAVGDSRVRPGQKVQGRALVSGCRGRL